jgi:hypothetical protein
VIEGRDLAVSHSTESDRDDLAAFRCSTGTWYEDEVEGFVNRRALDSTLNAPGVFKRLVMRRQGALIACAAHHVEYLLLGDGITEEATRIALVAVDVGYQGERLHDSTPLADALFRALLRDAIGVERFALVTGVVARENERSLRLCARQGLTSQVRYGTDYVRVTGRVGLTGQPE